MKPIEFKGHNVVFAKDQPEYLPLPAMILSEPGVPVISCWELSDADREEILKTGKIYIQQLTFGQPLQPIRPESDLSNYFEVVNE